MSIPEYGIVDDFTLYESVAFASSDDDEMLLDEGTPSSSFPPPSPCP